MSEKLFEVDLEGPRAQEDLRHLLADDERSMSSSRRRAPSTHGQTLLSRVLFFLPWGLNVVLLGLLFLSVSQTRDPGLAVYSPANPAVEYETLVMYDNIHDISPYQGYPDDEKDRLWGDLYGETSFTLIDQHAASKLPNKTMEKRPGEYLVQLEVFHQLHCLNSIRKSFYPERFTDEAIFYPNGTRNQAATIHYEHCLDRLRQGIQCASNVGTLFWAWREDKDSYLVNMTTTHTCRNFDKIKDWALERSLGYWADLTIPGNGH